MNAVIQIHTATKLSNSMAIGMEALGCIDSDSQALCPKFVNNQCSAGCAHQCAIAAMVNHQEAVAEISLASIALMANNNITPLQLRRDLSKVEDALQHALAA